MNIPDPSTSHTVLDVFGYDTFYLWTTGFLARHGRDFYDQNQLAAIMYQLGWPKDEYAHGALMPPWGSWLWALLALFPFQIARVVWLCVILAVIPWAQVRILKLMEAAPKSVWAPSTLALVFLYPWYWSNAYWGQYNFMLLIAFAFFVSNALRGQAFVAGLALSLSLFKVNLCMALYAYVAGVAVREKKPALLSGFLSGALLQLLCGELLVPGITWSYFAHAPFASGLSLPGASIAQSLQSIWGIRTELPLLMAGSACAFYYGVVAPLSPSRFFLVLVPLSMLITPYMWSHALLLLFPTYVMLARTMGPYFKKYTYHVLLLVLAALVPFIVFAWYEIWFSVLPALALIIGLTYGRQRRPNAYGH
jgi:hypothetical protein